MSSTSLRALAVTVAAIIAVLTGIATGLLSAPSTCGSGGTQAAAAPAPAVTASTGSGLVAEPAVNSPAARSDTARSCSPPLLAPAPALTAFGGAVLVGAALLVLLMAARRGGGDHRRGGDHRPARPVPTSGPPAGAAGAAGPSGPSPAAVRQSEADRAALVQACIYVRDRVTSRALADRLGAALREAGVATLEPTGVKFDPSHHEAGGAAPSDDPAKIGSIAAVEVPGYADRGGRVLRVPVVTVYQARSQREQQR
jgi:GrpE